MPAKTARLQKFESAMWGHGAFTAVDSSLAVVGTPSAACARKRSRWASIFQPAHAPGHAAAGVSRAGLELLGAPRLGADGAPERAHVHGAQPVLVEAEVDELVNLPPVEAEAGAGQGEDFDPARSSGKVRATMQAIPNTNRSSVIVSIEYLPDRVVLYDNPALGWLVDETGAEEPTPIVIGQLPAPSGDPVGSPQWAVFTDPAMLVPDRWRRSAADFYSWLSGSDERRLEARFAALAGLVNSFDRWAVPAKWAFLAAPARSGGPAGRSHQWRP